VSSIRLFILGSLDARGPMHGHALRLLAEEEHIDEWADFAVGAIYGAIKRLAAEELIEPLRVEREGNYPERQVYAVTDAGRASLLEIRSNALQTIVYRPDPFDLALARLGDETEDDVREVLEARLADFKKRLAHEVSHLTTIAKYLTPMEQQVMRHDSHRIAGEIAWHEELLGALPGIITTTPRKGQTQ
jgi:DNA-binding PadR family transcriptional regulator